MWVLPLVAAVVAFAFAGVLARQWLARRRPFMAIWVVALAMYGVASLAVVAGAADGWSELEFEVYWALGAVLNVPFLAAGEVLLLFRRRWVLWGTLLALVFVTAYTFTTLAGASYDAEALAETLPSGKHVYGAGTPAHRLPQLISIPSYLLLLAGTSWSAWTMRGHAELRDRFFGTLLIALGATITAVGGSAFAALGKLALFSVTLLAGIAVMFWGFLRASRQAAASQAGVPGSDGVDPAGSSVTSSPS
jgi:hypothetical protein